MKMSENIKEIASALSNFQSEVNNPKKTADNPYYKSKYAPLDEVINASKPLLAKYGLSYIQSTSGDGQLISITTLLMHSSGEWIESDPLTLKAVKTDPQAAGSAITYGRRYSLSAVLGLASESDDDANEVSIKKEYVCEKCGKAFEPFKDKNGKEWSAGQIYHISKNKHGQALCKACVSKEVKK